MQSGLSFQPAARIAMFGFLRRKGADSSNPPPPNGHARAGVTPMDPGTGILYSLGTIINVKPLERFEISSEEDGCFIVAKGRVSVLPRGHEVVLSMGEGEGISTAMLRDSGLHALSLQGTEAFKLVKVSSAAMRTIGGPIQSRIDQYTAGLVKIIRKSTLKKDPREEAPGDYVRSCLRQERRSLVGRYESSPFLQRALSEVESLPTVTQRFIGLSLSDSSSTAEITAFIKNNPSLSMEVLKVVNSSFHGLRNKVCDINYAVLYLGLSQIFQIVISAGLRGMAGKTSQLSHIYSHSVIVSNVAGLLAAAGERKASPIVATIGILHDVGEIFRFLIKERHDGLDLLVDHLSGPKLGAMLLAKWGIPEPIHKAIELSEQSSYSLPEELDEGLRHYVACLHVSHRVCDHVNEVGPPTDPLTQAYLSFLGFESMTLEQMVRLYLIPELRANTNKLPIEVQVFFSI